MKNLSLIAAFVLLAGIFALAAGCSSDKTNPVSAGDPNDPAYQYVDTTVFGDNLTDGISTMMDFAFILMDSIPGANVRQSPMYEANTAAITSVVFDSLNYQYVNGWHVFTFAAYAVNDFPLDTVDISGVDSVQALSGGTPLMVPDSTMDAFGYRAHVDMNSRVTGFTRNADQSIDISMDLTSGFMINISGNATEATAFTYVDTATTCDVTVNTSLNANNVMLDLTSNGCPESGSMTASAYLNMACTGSLTLNVNGNWNATATFNGLTTTLTVSDGTNYWTATDTCGSGPVMAGLWR